MANEEIKIVINADDRASGVLNKLSGTAGGLGNVLKGVGVVAGGLALGGIAALGAGVMSAVREFADAQQATAQLEAVLKSTRGAAGLFKDDLLQQAAALQKVTRYSDEAVLGAQSLLLTFTKVKGPVFQDAIGTILDMSTALGQDLKSSAIQVGKALNDPIEGVNALRRVGVSFTEEQQQQIKTMVESGKVMEAQKFILAELATEFGGSAKAAGETFAGQLDRLKNAGSDLLEVIGEPLVSALTPTIEKFVEFANSVTVQEKLQALVETIKTLIKFFTEDIPNAVGTVIEAITGWFNAMSEGFNSFVERIMEFDEVRGVVELVKESFRKLWDQVKTQLWPALQELWDTIKNQLWPAIMELWTALQPFMPFFEAFAKVVGAVVVAAIWVLIKVLTVLIEFTTLVLTWITKLTTFLVGTASSQIQKYAGYVQSVADAFKAVVDWVAKAINAIKEFANSSDKAAKIGNALVPGQPFGKRASGGPVSAARTYLVGERGPELFTPSQSGRIIPNSQLGGGGVVVNITGTFLSETAALVMADMVADQLKLQLRI